MTDKEMAVNWTKENVDSCRSSNMNAYEFAEQAFLVGLKAGRPKWHKIADADLPKEDNKIVLCIEINGYIENKPNYVYKLLTKNEFPFTHSLVAWCEIPKYIEG